jgi:hypothetical protein
MKTIKLPTGERVKVDDDFYPMLMTLGNWCRQSGRYAATRHRGKLLLMHNVVYEWRFDGIPEDRTVDHCDRDGFNNQTDNLRIATASQQCANRARSKRNTSGYKGVYLQKKSRRWLTQFHFQGKHYYDGCYDTPEEAADAYARLCESIAGEFAHHD